MSNVPKKNSVVATTGRKEPSIEREDDGRDGALVARHKSDAIACDAVPQTETTITWTWKPKTNKVLKKFWQNIIPIIFLILIKESFIKVIDMRWDSEKAWLIIKIWLNC